MTQDLAALRAHLARLQKRMDDLMVPAVEATLWIRTGATGGNATDHSMGFEGTDTGLKQCQALMIQATEDELSRVETEIAMLEKPAGGVQ